MAKVATSVRFDPETLKWADAQAKAAGMSRQQFLEGLVEGYKSEPEPGGVKAVTSYVEKVRGVGDCPESPEGHVWGSAADNPRRPCIHCRRPGRDGLNEIGGHVAQATMEQTELFRRLRTPDSAKGIKPKDRAA